jgi:hypothetical protein
MVVADAWVKREGAGAWAVIGLAKEREEGQGRMHGTRVRKIVMKLYQNNMKGEYGDINPHFMRSMC